MKLYLYKLKVLLGWRKRYGGYKLKNKNIKRV